MQETVDAMPGRLSMQPLSRFSPEARRGVRFVLTDIDDTLTDAGRLGAAAYGAMEALSAAGIAVVPVTGRPAGWCDHIARMWPVAAVVGENGAFYFRYKAETRRMERRFWRDDDTRRRDRKALDRLAEQILVQVPGTAIPSDQPYREADLAIDFAEDVPRLDDAAIDRIVALFRAAGAEAKVSSIHVNGWFGDYDKLAMSQQLLTAVFGMTLPDDETAVVFVGDAPNDQPMFGYFSNSVGVANVGDFLGRLETPPVWVTDARGGAGFVELATALLDARA